MGTFISCGSMTTYFVAPFVHASLVVAFKRKFGLLAIFLMRGSDSFVAKYINHVGLQIFILTSYVAVQMSLMFDLYVKNKQPLNALLEQLMMHYIYILDFMILTQHSAFANKIAIEYSRAGELLKRFLVFQAIHKNNEIFQYLEVANRIYGPQVRDSLLMAKES